ncbi:MAG: RecX family transcriptional regulator [Myxococcota bacterium]|nr:RecX family transcriptional regulator [Myxococcota bacterium]
MADDDRDVSQSVAGVGRYDPEAGRASGARRGRKPREKKKPKKPTDRYLTNVAKWYIERYNPCSGGLRRALMKRVNKGLREHGGDRDEAIEVMEGVVKKMVDNGTINDLSFARRWVASYHRRGVTLRDIAQRLRAKGVPRTVIDEAIKELEEAAEHDPALQAAVAYVRRRRFGPWRMDPRKREERREKDLAAMARAGHRYHIAKRVLELETLEDYLTLEEEIRD